MSAPSSPCPNCNYDLAGQLSAAKIGEFHCPECGAELRWRAERVRHSLDDFQVGKEPSDATRRKLRRFENVTLIVIFVMVILSPLLLWLLRLALTP